MMRSFKRIALLCGMGVLLAPAAWAENWQVAKDEEGIKISLSEVAGSKYKAYQGVTVIKAPLAKVQALQEDAVGACAWIHECKSQKLLKHEGDQSWTYTQFNTPWPVTPRDSVLQVATEPQFLQPVLEQEGRGTRVRAAEDLPPGDYFWRVASRDGNGHRGRFGQPVHLDLQREVDRRDAEAAHGGHAAAGEGPEVDAYR